MTGIYIPLCMKVSLKSPIDFGEESSRVTFLDLVAESVGNSAFTKLENQEIVWWGVTEFEEAGECPPVNMSRKADGYLNLD